MAPNIVVTIEKPNITMSTDQEGNSSEDLEIGDLTFESINESLNRTSFRSSFHNSTFFDNRNTHGPHASDAETSQSEIWGSNPESMDDDQSISNETGISPTTSHGGSVRRSNEFSDDSLGIAKVENLAVRTWRLVMFVVLILTTIAVAVIVYNVVYRAERHDFETSFRVDSEKIFESLGFAMDTKLEAVDSLAMMMVYSAKQHNQTWPFTVMPNYAANAAKTRMLSDAIALQNYHYVEENQRAEWEAFAKRNEAWVQEAIDVEREDTTLCVKVDIPDYDTNHSTLIRYSGPLPNNTGPYTPTWQTYPMLPPGTSSAYNFNAIQHPLLGPGIRQVLERHNVVIGPVLNFEDTKEKGGENRVSLWAKRHIAPEVDSAEPIIRILYPILDTAAGAITINEPDSKVVGIIASSFFIRSFIENILPNGERGLVVVFKNTCNQTFTYEVNGHDAYWMGPGDLHDPKFDKYGISLDMDTIGFHAQAMGKYGGLGIDSGFCGYTISTYPSETMLYTHHTKNPLYYTLISVGIFLFTALFMVAYDKLVKVRQEKVMKTAIQSTTLVSSLFPSNIRDRLLETNGATFNGNNFNRGNDGIPSDKLRPSMFQPAKTRLRTFMNEGVSSQDFNKPIADLFTETTVLFADIAGFTAWSSAREPTQVFTLLETVYGAFDTIAARRGVFKVETIGDSYMAVTGLPDPRKDHAVVMAKFARDCREKFAELCSSLESRLGPETSDLNLRIGLHSGPVTAGVLRGQKSRFQLFGDTVNTAARMESTGKVNKIQVSQSTAELLRNARKGHWLQPREEMVEAKGKGLMITFWVEPKIGSLAGSTCTATDITKSQRQLSVKADEPLVPRITSQTERLINWNIDVLERLLKKIVARRIALQRKATPVDWNLADEKTKIVLKEVQEVIKLPEYDSKYSDLTADSIVLEPRVRFQLREFVTAIALTYHENPFHNFPHASHVGMSVAKLLSRIVAPDIEVEGHEQLHDHTYGITSDPLTQFACVFAALIHDADHPGVPNSQLVKEDTKMAEIYKGKSIAEQNSINLAWGMLLEEKYKELRKAICRTQHEACRFRQLVVNAVCATDIIDKDLKAARNKRWEKAFSPNPVSAVSIKSASSSNDTETQEQINRKATIVIEHIIQASDVAHTMQHWHVYIKWNERLFAEMYKAYTEGRAEKDPTDNWYRNEIGFFDFYIIPLAQKLAECGVFGVSSDEYLNYAIMNRNEWEKKGLDVVASYVRKYKLSDTLDRSGRNSAPEHIIEQP